METVLSFACVVLLISNGFSLPIVERNIQKFIPNCGTSISSTELENNPSSVTDPVLIPKNISNNEARSETTPFNFIKIKITELPPILIEIVEDDNSYPSDPLESIIEVPEKNCNEGMRRDPSGYCRDTFEAYESELNTP